MKIKIKLILIIILFSSVVSFSQWSFFGCPKASVVTATTIKFNGSDIYIGSYDGVFRSKDNGSSWEAINTGLPKSSSLYNINCLEILGANIFVGTNDGIYHSFIDSSSWQKLVSILDDKIITSIKFFGQSMFVSTLFNGVFVSADGGDTWSEANSGLSSKVVYELISDNSNLFLRNDGQIYFSQDSAKSWKLIELKTNGFFSSIAAKGSNIYVGTSWGYLYYSGDYGKNWKELKPSYTNNTIQFIIINDKGVFYVDDFGIYSSINNGTTWSSVKSTLPNESIYSITLNDEKIYTGIFRDGIYYSTDNGSNWALFGKIYDYSSLLSLTVSARNILCGTYDGLYRSSNSGSTWTLSNSGLSTSSYTPFVYSLTNNNLNFFAASDEGVFLSVDNGRTWKAPNTKWPLYVYPRAIITVDSNIFAATNQGIYFSTIHGKSWIQLNQGLPSKASVYSLGSDGTNLYAGLKNNIYTSSNNGQSWEMIDLGTLDWTIIGFVFSDSNLFILSNGTVYFTRDMGKNWRLLEEGLPKATSICSSNSYLYVATESAGIWKRSMSEIISGIDEKQKIIPNDFVLFQNYPNPFNPSTTIEYSIPKQSHVTIKIYDLLGREIITLVDQDRSIGNHSVNFDGSSLSSGIYFYRLTAGEFIETKKLILLR